MKSASWHLGRIKAKIGYNMPRSTGGGCSVQFLVNIGFFWRHHPGPSFWKIIDVGCSCCAHVGWLHPGHSRSSLRLTLFRVLMFDHVCILLFFAILRGKFNGPAKVRMIFLRAWYLRLALLVWNKWFHSYQESGSTDIKPHQAIAFSNDFSAKPLVFPTVSPCCSMLFCFFFRCVFQVSPWLLILFFPKIPICSMFFHGSPCFFRCLFCRFFPPKNPRLFSTAWRDAATRAEDLPPLLHGAGQEAGRRASQGSPVGIYLGYFEGYNLGYSQYSCDVFVCFCDIIGI